MITKTDLTLEDFWALPEGETAYELVDGLAIPKVSPKYFHSSLQRAIDRLISAWCKRMFEKL
jgi:Uma2 family endonuclease